MVGLQGFFKRLLKKKNSLRMMMLPFPAKKERKDSTFSGAVEKKGYLSGLQSTVKTRVREL